MTMLPPPALSAFTLACSFESWRLVSVSSVELVTHPVSPFTQSVVNGMHDRGTIFSTNMFLTPRDWIRARLVPILSTTVVTKSAIP